MPDVSDFLLAIESYFDQNATAIANDILADSIETWEIDDVVIQREMQEDAADGAQYRMKLATDSASWQGYQVGRLDKFTEGGYDQLIDWVLDPGAQHCETCLEYARNSPYPANRLPGIPGQAPTICNGSCRCSLVPHAIAAALIYTFEVELVLSELQREYRIAA